MNDIVHHPGEDLLVGYSTGALGHAFSLVVASHLSMCDKCRQKLDALSAIGGALLDEVRPSKVGAHLKDHVMSRLDISPRSEPTYERKGIYPGPIMAELSGQAVRWTEPGRTIRQQVLFRSKDTSARLLYIPPGRAVPDHGHRGMELTLVLQGSFTDSDRTYRPGDVEVADEAVQHEPMAGGEEACICLAATDARLKFKALSARIVQPFLGI